MRVGRGTSFGSGLGRRRALAAPAAAQTWRPIFKLFVPRTAYHYSRSGHRPTDGRAAVGLFGGLDPVSYLFAVERNVERQGLPPGRARLSTREKPLAQAHRAPASDLTYRVIRTMRVRNNWWTPDFASSTARRRFSLHSYAAGRGTRLHPPARRHDGGAPPRVECPSPPARARNLRPHPLPCARHDTPSIRRLYRQPAPIRFTVNASRTSSWTSPTSPVLDGARAARDLERIGRSTSGSGDRCRTTSTSSSTCW